MRETWWGARGSRAWERALDFLRGRDGAAMRPHLCGVALLVWGALVLGSAASRCRLATTWIDLPATLSSGPAGWLAAAAWGMRCRWEGEAREDRQRLSDACGPAALRAVLRHRGLDATQELLWSLCRTPGGGTTLGRLAVVARRFGHEPRLIWDPWLEHVQTPAIVHLGRGHFVVLERCSATCAWILDPACGRLRVPLGVLRRSASGATLTFPGAPATAGGVCTPERKVTT